MNIYIMPEDLEEWIDSNWNNLLHNTYILSTLEDDFDPNFLYEISITRDAEDSVLFSIWYCDNQGNVLDEMLTERILFEDDVESAYKNYLIEMDVYLKSQHPQFEDFDFDS